MTPRLLRRALCGALLPLALSARAEAPLRDAALFAAWRLGHAEAVDAFARRLGSEGLDGVAPLHELLRSASSWHDCGAQPFAVPPDSQWADAVSVLRLLQALRAEGVLTAVELHSGYRDEALNRCAGGAPGSAHLRRFAIDLTPLDAADPTAALCRFWQIEGARWRMGLGRYASGRIHIDTAGWRRWGGDDPLRPAGCEAVAAATG